MGLEAVEVILKAIQGAKNRRAEGEDAQARLQLQKEQLKNAQDEFKVTEARLNKAQELAEAVADAQMANTRQQTLLSQSKMLESIESGQTPAPPGYGPVGGGGAPTHRETTLPPIPQNMEMTDTARQEWAMQPSPTRTVANTTYNYQTPTGPMIMRSPEERARQVGNVKALEELATEEQKFGIRERGAESDLVRKFREMDKGADIDTKENDRKLGRAIVLSETEADQKAAAAKLHEAAEDRRLKWELNNRFSIAALGKIPDASEKAALNNVYDKFVSGEYTEEDLKKQGFSKGEQQLIRNFMNENNYSFTTKEKVKFLVDMAPVGTTIDDMDPMISKLTPNDYKGYPAAVAGAMVAKDNFTRLGFNDASRIKQLSSRAPLIARDVLGQMRSSDRDAAGAAGAALLDAASWFGSGDNQQSAREKRNFAAQSYIDAIDRVTGNMPPAQKIKILEGLHIKVPKILGGMDTPGAGAPGGSDITPGQTGDPAVDNAPKPKAPGPAAVPKTTTTPQTTIVPPPAAPKAAPNLIPVPTNIPGVSNPIPPAATTGGVKKNRP